MLPSKPTVIYGDKAVIHRPTNNHRVSDVGSEAATSVTDCRSRRFAKTCLALGNGLVGTIFHYRANESRRRHIVQPNQVDCSERLSSVDCKREQHVPRRAVRRPAKRCAVNMGSPERANDGVPMRPITRPPQADNMVT